MCRAVKRYQRRPAWRSQVSISPPKWKLRLKGWCRAIAWLEFLPEDQALTIYPIGSDALPDYHDQPVLWVDVLWNLAENDQNVILGGYLGAIGEQARHSGANYFRYCGRGSEHF